MHYPLRTPTRRPLAAGAGFRKPLTELAAAYEAQSGRKLPQTYGHLGQVVAQARESGKISIVCGDKAVLEKAKDISFAKMVPRGLGKLALSAMLGALSVVIFIVLRRSSRPVLT